MLNRFNAALQRGAVIDLLDRQNRDGEADEGLAVIPSCGLPVCQNRKVLMSRLIHPLVNVEFCQISNRGKRLPPGAEEFTALPRSYIAGSRVGLARFSRHLWYS
jgi:hypothetical protein